MFIIGKKKNHTLYFKVLDKQLLLIIILYISRSAPDIHNKLKRQISALKLHKQTYLTWLFVSSNIETKMNYTHVPIFDCDTWDSPIKVGAYMVMLSLNNASTRSILGWFQVWQKGHWAWTCQNDSCYWDLVPSMSLRFTGKVTALSTAEQATHPILWSHKKTGYSYIQQYLTCLFLLPKRNSRASGPWPTLMYLCQSSESH